MMKFLKRLLTILTDYYRIEIKDRLPRIVSSRETLTRYLLSKKLFSRVNNRVKPQAFMPPADLKLSVFRTDKLSEFQIWKIGEKRVARKAQPPRNIHGRVDIKALKVAIPYNLFKIYRHFHGLFIYGKMFVMRH